MSFALYGDVCSPCGWRRCVEQSTFESCAGLCWFALGGRYILLARKDIIGHVEPASPRSRRSHAYISRSHSTSVAHLIAADARLQQLQLRAGFTTKILPPYAATSQSRPSMLSHVYAQHALVTRYKLICFACPHLTCSMYGRHRRQARASSTATYGLCRIQPAWARAIEEFASWGCNTAQDGAIDMPIA